MASSYQCGSENIKYGVGSMAVRSGGSGAKWRNEKRRRERNGVDVHGREPSTPAWRACAASTCYISRCLHRPASPSLPTLASPTASHYHCLTTTSSAYTCASPASYASVCYYTISLANILSFSSPLLGEEPSATSRARVTRRHQRQHHHIYSVAKNSWRSAAQRINAPLA